MQNQKNVKEKWKWGTCLGWKKKKKRKTKKKKPMKKKKESPSGKILQQKPKNEEEKDRKRKRPVKGGRNCYWMKSNGINKCRAKDGNASADREGAKGPVYWQEKTTSKKSTLRSKIRSANPFNRNKDNEKDHKGDFCKNSKQIYKMNKRPSVNKERAPMKKELRGGLHGKNKKIK